MPLIIFVCAYWKILLVVRRQAKVTDDRRKATGKAKEPVAGTSRGMAETKLTEVTKEAGEKSQKEVKKEMATTMSKGRRQVDDQQRSTPSLSQAKINVMKTMIYIVVCFVVCWMPRNIFVLYMQFAVR